ncbi:putative AAA family ATPase [Candidatus Termititenax aidoneus]|uniref:AAA family ATPase n=1 Tax=Termititenax aidoneus TaxID=2218524 RepID=A0A388TC33_TERA1|nr:putative AAA family ATPase [Candidatus Termititenax aidoneus]
MIIRQEYLDQLKLLKDQKVIKVITGIRRSGKSTLLKFFRDELEKQGIKKSQIQSFNFEEEKNVELRDWRTLHQIIEKKLVPTEINYIFLDEIQKVDNFEEVVDSLFVKENVDLYITGSNAFLLSGELSTLLTGRYISLHLLPFSFKEFAEMYPDEQNEDRLFEKYLTHSSFPEVITLSKVNEKLGSNYLRDLYDTVVNKDIAERYKIRNETDFARVVKFVFNSVGTPISARNIANALKLKNNSIFHGTVINYLKYLTKSYLIYPVSRYDIKGKKLLTTNDKYYVVDLGLRNILLGNSPKSDIGHRLENIVYLELLRRGDGEIFVGKNEDSEVDFIVQKISGERVYYQVAYQVNDRPETLERELLPFKKIRDNYPKILLTMDLVPEEFNGVKKINVVDWLLEK